MIKLFERCPACGGPITITECTCDNCHLQMRGQFRPELSKLSSLTDDQVAFVQVFLRARGNISEVEKILGVSYPTIRNKLDEVNRALERGAPVDSSPAKSTPVPASSPQPADAARRAILERVSSGALPAADALQELRNLQGGH